MGLDMYFETSKGQELMYWRKANAIHNFFVQECGQGIDECQQIVVTRDHLKDLRDRCIEVKDSLDNSPKRTVKIETGWKNELNPETGEREMVPMYADIEVYANTSVVEKLLPPVSGFFFGPTEIDEWYYQELESTIKFCDDVLNNPEYEDDRFIYQASW